MIDALGVAQRIKTAQYPKTQSNPKASSSSSLSKPLRTQSTREMLLQLPLSQFKSLTLTSSFNNGPKPTTLLRKPSFLSLPNPRRRTVVPPIRAMRSMQGRVVCATNDKTVSVEVVRLAPHPKYKRRVRKKKKYQAHDPENRFKVGDFVELLKSRPISKTKAFIAVPMPPRNVPKPKKEVVPPVLGLPLQSQQT